MALVGQAVSEKKIFEIVDGRTDGRQTTDGRTPDHGHPISSPCEPNGSGELKMNLYYEFNIIIGLNRQIIGFPERSPRGYKTFFRLKFILLINVKMPTIVGI